MSVSKAGAEPVEIQPVRDYRSCPHRHSLRMEDGDEWADCALVKTIAGEELAKNHCNIRDEGCHFCSQWAVPTPRKINPMVGSLLFTLTREVRSEPPPPGMEPSERQLLLNELEKLATNNLIIVGGNENHQQAKAPPYEGTCFHIGKQVGERDCKTCRGSVRLKVFGCRHELHDETTIRSCQTCPDYDPNLKSKKASRWAVGVTTAPRQSPTLEQTLESLASAGWDDPVIFAEPGSDLPQSAGELRVTQRRVEMGAWGNWLLALTEIYLENPHADAYFMCQDDVVYPNGLRNYLEETLWPAERLGVVSLHTPSHHANEEHSGYFSKEVGWGAWGAMGYVFPNASARALLRDGQVLNHRQRGLGKGRQNVDSVVGFWCQRRGLPYILHSPSLSQHIGETSTLWENATLGGRRSASDFRDDAEEISGEMDNREEGSSLAIDCESCAGPSHVAIPRRSGIAVVVHLGGDAIDLECPAALSADGQELPPDEKILLWNGEPSDLEEGWRAGTFSGKQIGGLAQSALQSTESPWIAIVDQSVRLANTTLADLVGATREAAIDVALVDLPGIVKTAGAPETESFPRTPIVVRRSLLSQLEELDLLDSVNSLEAALQQLRTQASAMKEIAAP